MSVRSYLTGVGTLAVIVLPWVLVGARCRIWLAPSARGATARLVEAIIGISGLVVVVEIVGAGGGFHRLPLALASAGSATALAVLAMRCSPKVAPTIAQPAPVAKFDVAVVAAAVLAVTAQWLAGVTSSYRTGILQVESLHYHLPTPPTLCKPALCGDPTRSVPAWTRRFTR